MPPLSDCSSARPPLCLVVPHITNAIQDWVERVAKLPTDGTDAAPDVCIIEVSFLLVSTRSLPIRVSKLIC
jgi:CTP synthase (UTP-ammonia lyase)